LGHNRAPFASGNALFGLSKLSVWWLRLGIQIQRIKPGHPEQNGRHERMHLTLKKEATQPASFNFLQQQRFDQLSGSTTMSGRTRHSMAPNLAMNSWSLTVESGSTLTAAAAESSSAEAVPILLNEELEPIVNEAVRRWD
jgi:transposase InsO family protein